MANTNDARPVYIGGCFCGDVRYRCEGEVTFLTNCYCKTCRILHGAPFATFGHAASEDIVWVEKKGLKELRLSTFATRGFCASCGANVFMVYDFEPDSFGLVAASVDEEQSTGVLPAPDKHIFVKEKVNWYKITDKVPQFPGHTPEFQNILDQLDSKKKS